MRYKIITTVLVSLIVIFVIDSSAKTNSKTTEEQISTNQQIATSTEPQIATTTEEHIKVESEKEYPIYCSCVKTARASGLDLPPIIDPSVLVPNSPPVIGGGVLMQYANIPHVAVITGFSANGIIVVEGNFNECQKQTREILLTDPHIRGFWVPTEA